MFLSITELFEFSKSTHKSQNFLDAEKIINAGLLTISDLINENSDQYNILSYCLNPSACQDKPHEIVTIIDTSGKVVSSKCSCAVELDTCKHIIATLLFCTRNDLSKLKKTSTTDQLMWDAQKACSKEYDVKPLFHHKCFQIEQKEQELPYDVQEAIRELIFSKDLKSILSQHVDVDGDE